MLATFAPFFVLNPAADSAAPLAASGPTYYTPSQVSHAYGFDNINFGGVKGDGSGQTIAIVDAYDNPNIGGDLATFDAQFNLPGTTSAGVASFFTKVNQNGGSTPPAANTDWANEIALDVEWAHAMAPGAKIVLVEANSNSISDLFQAVRYAAQQSGASVVSMSWGGSEWPSETSFDSYFTSPASRGVSFVASSGDSGAPVSYPAISPNVLAVGGSSLYLDAQNNYSSESGWSGSTGGISGREVQPSYQTGIVTQSTTSRTSPDVSYDADPSTGFVVYNSYSSPSYPWEVFGGTSAGAPQWAALVAIADQGRTLNGQGTLDGRNDLLPDIYKLPSADFHDVISGGSSGAPSYSAGPGYDLVTGRGSPIANLIVADLVGHPASVSATHFNVTAASSVTAGSRFTFTVTAESASNNPVAGYVGAVHFTSSDAFAFLPQDYTFAASDNGSHTFSVILKTPGNQTIVVADNSNSTIAGSVGVAVVSSTRNSTLLEGFEGPETWKVVGASTPTAYESTAAAHNGTYGLDQYSGNDWIYRNDAAAQVKAGDTLSVWLKFSAAADGRAYFGFGSSATGTLALVAAPNTGQLLLLNVSNYSNYIVLGASNQRYQANHWYRVEIDWGASGKIVGKLFDSDGQSLLGQVAATTSAIASGGIAFRAFGHDKYWDTVADTPGANPFAAPSASPATTKTHSSTLAGVKPSIATRSDTEGLLSIAPSAAHMVVEDADRRRIAAVDRHFASDSSAMGYSLRLWLRAASTWFDAQG